VTVTVFESEAKARLREQDERRQPGLQSVGETMARISDGAPEVIELDVIVEHSGV
jgi:hypothetical protein